MKIAVTATSPSLEADIDPRFGRCQYFIYADPETLKFEAEANATAFAGEGAGISTAQTIATKKVEAILTGNCGPNAHQVLSAAGIKVFTGVTGKVRDAIENFKAGKFREISHSSVPNHYGSSGGESGTGLHMARGMGKCRRIGAVPPETPSSTAGTGSRWR